MLKTNQFSSTLAVISGFLSRVHSYGFNGKEKDDKYTQGNYDFGERIYNASLGRFFSIDPMNPSSESVYSYAANNPIAFIDVDGEWPCWSCWAQKALPIISTVLDFVPIVGQIKGIAEAVIGYSLDGTKLEPWERAAAFIPGGKIASKVVKVGKAAIAVVTTRKVADKIENAIKKVHVKVKAKSVEVRVVDDVDEGIIYRRTDLTSNEKPYIGQAKNESRFEARQKEHARKNKDADYEFEIIDRDKPGKDLDLKEQQHIDLGGGPTNKSNPDGGLSNKRNQIKDRGSRKSKITI